MIKKETYCNVCGSKFGHWDVQEGYSIHTTCGYGSKYDGQELVFDICIDCMEKIIDKCTIDPVISDYDDEDYVGVLFNENKASKN